ncbi:LysM peptidoglycan-binding domain-containing protein [Psychrobacter fjordensis]|uniref:LysM peptidoglycan-binding domain-containing protein n=1 Tax=Psychrobacter fjordensis TaxID=664424 RepID=UPI00191A70FF|nr:LysM peptidoglycan-binding domain-containing protein [Psychrobacter fjordensis]
MSKTKSIVFHLKFVDLLNNPFPNLYHEIRELGQLISANTSNAQGLGTPISRPPGTILVVHIRHPLTKKMIVIKELIKVPDKKGTYTIKAPFYIQVAKLKALHQIQNSYKRSTHKVESNKDEYEVKKDQDLYTIAKMYNTTWQILAQLNKATIKDPNKIVPGQVIKVPPKGSSLTGKTNDRPDSLTSQTHYEVKKGDTLSSISQRSGVSVEQLQRMNGITNPTTLQADQTIKLRSDGSAQTHITPKPSLTPTPRPTPKPSSEPSSSDEEEGFFDDLLESIGDGLGALGNKAKEELEDLNEAMSGGKNDKPAGGAPMSDSDAKSKSNTPVKIPVEQEYSSKDGTPKIVSGAVCKDNPACIFKGKTTNEAEKKLVLEVNIRLAGFGGALPSSDFTDLTENCIKQFQRDYMKAPETGKICGSLIKAIDEFNYKYPIGPYYEQMKCPCGQCSGFGNSKMGVPSGRNIANEYPGIHRSTVWMLKATMFYLDSVYPELKFTLESIDSGYRCIVRNVQKNRTTVNHMGLAFDLHFNKNGVRTKSTTNMEKIREIIFIRHMNATLTRANNKIWLEPSKWNDGSNAATTWVHYDVSKYEKEYLKNSFFAKTVSGMIGGDLSSHANNKMLACGGDFNIKTKKDGTLEDLIVQLGTVISHGEGSYEAWNSGAPEGHKVKFGSMKGSPGEITHKTINQLLQLSKDYTWKDQRRRFATGKYQTIPNTLEAGRKALGLSGNELYDATMQERIFREYLVIKQPLLKKFIKKGTGSIDDAQQGAAQEWASIGLPKNGTNMNDERPVLIQKGGGMYTGFYESRTNHANAESTKKVREILTKIYYYHHP